VNLRNWPDRHTDTYINTDRQADGQKTDRRTEDRQIERQTGTNMAH